MWGCCWLLRSHCCSSLRGEDLSGGAFALMHEKRLRNVQKQIEMIWAAVSLPLCVLCHAVSFREKAGHSVMQCLVKGSMFHKE
jgi:hypothetical protein